MKYIAFYILILFFVSLLATRRLPFINYFNSHDNTTPSRQLQMHKCFLDLQFPCRWVPDFGNGYGYPLFNYYPPLPYLVGEPFMLAGLSQYNAVKISFFLSLFLSGVAMSFLGSKFFNNLSGLISGVLYIWAPYRAVDIYVRGALNESWSFVFIPLILLFSYNVIAKNKGPLETLFLAFSWAGLLLSHNLISLMFIPFFIVWIIFLLCFLRSFNRIVPIFVGSVLGLCIASFFTLPVLFEKNLVWLDFISGYFNYRDHFVYIYQLFVDNSWEYGFSFAGTGDGMSFQIGFLHYLIPIVVFIVSSVRLVGSFSKVNLIAFVTFILGLFAIFMTSDLSQYIWNIFPILAIVQFPWRFLTISITFFSLSGGYLFFLINKKWQYLFSFLIIFVVIVLNWNYFLPDTSSKFVAKGYFEENLRDYLPITSPEGPQNPRNEIVSPSEINIFEVKDEKSGTDWFNFTINSERYTSVIINILQFPNWNIYVDKQKVNDYTDNAGLIQIDIPNGTHEVYGELENTPIRTFSNIVSIISIMGSLFYIIFFYPFLKFKPTAGFGN